MTELFGGNPTEPQTDPNAQPAAPVAPVVPETPPVVPETPPVTPPVQDPSTMFANQLAGIQSDDGRQKYVDVPTALASIPHAQEHIKSLNEKNAHLEQELAKMQGMEEVLKRMEPQKQQVVEPPSNTGLNEEQTAQLVENVLSLREQKTIAQNNQTKVIEALTAKYGEKAEEVYLNKAKELGVAETFLTEIALRSPEAVLAYFDVAKAAVQNPTAPGFSAPVQPVDTKPIDPMSRFRAGESELVQKWRSVTSNE